MHPRRGPVKWLWVFFNDSNKNSFEINSNWFEHFSEADNDFCDSRRSSQHLDWSQSTQNRKIGWTSKIICVLLCPIRSQILGQQYNKTADVTIKPYLRPWIMCIQLFTKMYQLIVFVLSLNKKLYFFRFAIVYGVHGPEKVENLPSGAYDKRRAYKKQPSSKTLKK